MVKEVNEFTWHQVSEEEKEQIKKDSKNLLDEFSKKLEKIRTKEGHFHSPINETGLREEGEGWQTDEDFRELVFDNAPFSEDDSIIAEKGGWK